MAVNGHEIIKSCTVCYTSEGISIRLLPEGESAEASEQVLVCPRDPSHRFRIVNGFLKRV